MWLVRAFYQTIQYKDYRMKEYCLEFSQNSIIQCLVVYRINPDLYSNIATCLTVWDDPNKILAKFYVTVWW